MLTILKHAKNFVGDRSDKPIFQGVHFTGNEIAVTNTRVLVFKTNYPSDVKTIHYKTGIPLDVIYPAVMKCIPLDSKISFEFNGINDWINALKICMLVTKGSDYSPCSLKSDAGRLQLVASCRGIYSSYPPVNLLKGYPLENISFNAKYLHDILVFFKESGVTVVTMGFNTALSPIKLTTDKDVLAILMPLRWN